MEMRVPKTRFASRRGRGLGFVVGRRLRVFVGRSGGAGKRKKNEKTKKKEKKEGILDE